MTHIPIELWSMWVLGLVTGGGLAGLVCTVVGFRIGRQRGLEQRDRETRERLQLAMTRITGTSPRRR